MNHRVSTLHPQKTYTSDTTEIIDINVADPISALILELVVTHGASGSPTAHELACMTKIELVDGSEVLFSLTGQEADALDFYCNKTQRSNFNIDLTGNGTQRFVGINFGRFPWDEALALDPKKYENLQLKISLDIDGGGDNPSNNKLTVYALLFDEQVVAPMGFLMAKQIKDFTMAASSWEYTDLPVDHTYRKLLVKCLTAGSEPNQLIETFKLSQDQDKKVILNHGADVWLRTAGARTPAYVERRITYVGTSSTSLFCTPTTRVAGSIMEWKTAAAANYLSFYDGDGGRYKAIAAAAATNAIAIITGWLPHGVFDLPFGIQDNFDNWFNVEGIGSLQLSIKGASGASSSNTCQIIAQQLVKYPA